jgi:hypothetical protein
LCAKARDPKGNTAVNGVTKTVKTLAKKGALEIWETKINKFEVISQSI